MAIEKAELPYRPDYLGEVTDFLANGWGCAKVTHDGVSKLTLYQSLKRVIRRHPDKAKGVKCVMRKGDVYLVRAR